MKQRFKAREGWLFAPFLLIIAAAFYWARIEKVAPPHPQGVYVSDFKVEPSPGLWRVEGFSHQVTVTLSHGEPKPLWWGTPTKFQNPADPFQTADFFAGPGVNDPAHALAYGGTLTYQRAGKAVAWTMPHRTHPFGARFVDDHYEFVHQLSLAQAPPKLGAINFRGLYVIGEQPPLTVTRPLRAAGETVAAPKAEGTGIKLLRVDATPFYQMGGPTAGGKLRTDDTCYIRFTVRDFEAPSAGQKLPTLMISDLKFGDDSTKQLDTNTGKGFDWGWLGGPSGQKLPAGQRDIVISLAIAPTFKTTGRLTCRGNLSIDQRKPIAFEVTLPPRQSKPQVAGSFDKYEIPLWRGGRALPAPGG